LTARAKSRLFVPRSKHTVSVINIERKKVAVGYDIHIKVKVKQSRNKPGVAQRVPGGLGSQIFMTFGM
jgi:hypothetical protein